MSHKVILQLSNHLEKKANNLLSLGIFEEAQNLQQVQGLINRHWLNKTFPHYKKSSDWDPKLLYNLKSGADLSIPNGYLVQIQQN